MARKDLRIITRPKRSALITRVFTVAREIFLLQLLLNSAYRCLLSVLINKV